MKRHAPFFIAIAILLPMVLLAQNDDLAFANTTSDSYGPTTKSHDNPVILAYHVEERINMNFGGRITTYTVSSLSLVNTNDLGKGNSRVITPIYAKTKEKSALPAVAADVALSSEKPKAELTFTPIEFPETMDAPVVKEEKKYAYINFTDTYERILSKGYKSVDMLKRVANSRFFDGNLESAAKWYSVLFDMTTDLDETYFYHYAQALTSLHQTDKATKIMEMFAQRTK